jgi:hypothetical protein
VPEEVSATRRRRRNPGATSRLVAIEQAHEEYGPPPTSIRDLINRGALAFVRFPGSRRIWIERSAIERLILESRRVRS